VTHPTLPSIVRSLPSSPPKSARKNKESIPINGPHRIFYAGSECRLLWATLTTSATIYDRRLRHLETSGCRYAEIFRKEIRINPVPVCSFQISPRYCNCVAWHSTESREFNSQTFSRSSNHLYLLFHQRIRPNSPKDHQTSQFCHGVNRGGGVGRSLSDH